MGNVVPLKLDPTTSLPAQMVAGTDVLPGSLTTPGITTQPSNGYVLQLTDAGNIVNTNIFKSLTVPADAQVNFPIGTTIAVYAYGDPCTLTPGSGVTFVAPDQCYTLTIGDTWLLRKVAANTWAISPYGGRGGNSNFAFVSGTKTIDVSTGDYFTLLLQGNTTLAFTNLPDSTRARTFAVSVQQPATGGPYTLTLPSICHPIGNTPTAIGTAANQVTLIVFTTLGVAVGDLGYAMGTVTP